MNKATIIGIHNCNQNENVEVRKMNHIYCHLGRSGFTDGIDIQGRGVDICDNHVWRTVCDDFWGMYK